MADQDRKLKITSVITTIADVVVRLLDLVLRH